MVSTTEEQQTIGLMDKLLSIESELSILLRSKTKIQSKISCANYKNIDSIPKKKKKDVNCNDNIDLQSRIYLLSVLQYFNFTFCNQYYILLCGRRQLVSTKIAILAICVISFEKQVSITIHYISLFKIIKNCLKRICAFLYIKIKLLTQFVNPMLRKLFSLAALPLSLPIRLVSNKIATLWPYTDPTLLKPFALILLFFHPQDCLQSLEINIQSPVFQVIRGHYFALLLNHLKKKHDTNLITKRTKLQQNIYSSK